MMEWRSKMQPNEQREETDEEFLARLRAMRAKRKAAEAAAAEAAKPRLEIPVTPKLAEAVKANPDSLRLSAKAADESVVVERPRRTEIVEVVEVDRQGRPAVGRRLDLETNEWSVIEFAAGYRPQPGAVSDYNPLAGLRRSEDE
jgi:hypothetical protein